MSTREIEANPKPNTDCINLVTSILLCYPEISIVSIEPISEHIKFRYTLDYSLKKEDINKLTIQINDCLKTYCHLLQLHPTLLEVDVIAEDKFSIINVKRDLLSFTRGELNLLRELLNEKYAKHMLQELKHIPATEVTALFESSTIDTMLSKVKATPIQETMIGVCDDGRVIVYNK